MQAGSSRDNNFDLLRLGAAIAVLASHCYPLTASGEDPLQRWTGHTGGELGVTIFFAISGYYGISIYAFLVQQSIAHLIPDISPGAMLALALPVTLVLGRASWRLVEEPALRRKPRRPRLARHEVAA